MGEAGISIGYWAHCLEPKLRNHCASPEPFKLELLESYGPKWLSIHLNASNGHWNSVAIERKLESFGQLQRKNDFTNHCHPAFLAQKGHARRKTKILTWFAQGYALKFDWTATHKHLCSFPSGTIVRSTWFFTGPARTQEVARKVLHLITLWEQCFPRSQLLLLL